MAEEKKESAVPETVIFLAALLLGMGALAWSEHHLHPGNGIFLAPPPPLGSGAVYGPTIGTSTPTTTNSSF